jgi:hypothetical protein
MQIRYGEDSFLLSVRISSPSCTSSPSKINSTLLWPAADAGSIYDPHPLLTYEWDASGYDAAASSTSAGTGPPPFIPSQGQSFDLGPHPADPTSMILPAPAMPTPFMNGSGSSSGHRHRYSRSGAAQIQHARGQEIWVYPGHGGTFTFWRFALSVPLGPREMKVKYSINSGQQLEFHVPGRNQNMRYASHSVRVD